MVKGDRSLKGFIPLLDSSSVLCSLTARRCEQPPPSRPSLHCYAAWGLATETLSQNKSLLAGTRYFVPAVTKVTKKNIELLNCIIYILLIFYEIHQDGAYARP